MAAARRPWPPSLFLYRLGILVYTLAIRIAALWNAKARERMRWLRNQHVRRPEARTVLWVHCASVGEFEQARPVIEGWRGPDRAVVVTIFSGSGLARAGTWRAVADAVYALPPDRPCTVRSFVDDLRPDLFLNIRYEHWYELLTELERRHIPTVLVAATVRPGQPMLRRGRLFSVLRTSLARYTAILARDTASAQALARAGFDATVGGDPRADRVRIIARTTPPHPDLAAFGQRFRVLVAGSTWPADEAVLARWWRTRSHDTDAVLIAPHDVTPSRVAAIEHRFPEAVRFTDGISPHHRVVILDTTGMLAACYGMGTWAWVGGGFGHSVHNVLEAAVHQVPVFFGPNHHKQREAGDLADIGGARVVQRSDDLLLPAPDSADYAHMARSAGALVQANSGATDRIVSTIEALHESKG